MEAREKRTQIARVVFSEAERVDAEEFAGFVTELERERALVHFRKITDAFKKGICNAWRRSAPRRDALDDFVRRIETEELCRAADDIAEVFITIEIKL